MIEHLPVELIEKILFYLTIVDLYNFIEAFGRKYSLLSDHFWRTICLREDFLQVAEHQVWSECFNIGVNKRCGNFVHCDDIPAGKLEHVCSTSLIVSDSLNVYNVYGLDFKNDFELRQSISATSILFKDEFILAQKEAQVIIYKYNWESHKFSVFKKLDENIDSIFGISSKYCSVYKTKKKLFYIYFFCNDSIEFITLPEDVKFIIERILHDDNIVISTVTFNTGYRIKMYNLKKLEWILDLKCFTSTGITNDPNVWVGTNFIACCDVSYRLRGIYFGPFKVWNIQGEKLFQVDIEPSNKHYLRCFFKDKYVLITTSDNCIKTYDSLGDIVSSINTKIIFEDIKLSAGYLLFILMKEIPSIDIYDWKNSSHLYSLSLNYEFSASLFNEFLYCPYRFDRYEVFNFS